MCWLMFIILFFFVDQLSRLHMILKPFMLRRIKKDVEHEMAEKVTTDTSHSIAIISSLSQVEVHLRCALSTRQRRLYHRLRERISIDDLLHSSNQQISKDSTSHLMNLVMQFRKVLDKCLFSCAYFDGSLSGV